MKKPSTFHLNIKMTITKTQNSIDRAVLQYVDRTIDLRLTTRKKVK